ncbi:MAG: regulatory protein TetR [Aeromicrobium sp.]|nr:regulatory protein TetR [Aeromicrobium sp.]
MREVVSSERVKDAALTLFAQRGYHGAALSEIAEALQIRTPSLYNHMTSKHGLLVDIVSGTTQSVWADFVEATSGDLDVVARLRAAVYAYALRHATHPREALIVNRDADSLEPPFRDDIMALRRKHEQAVRAIIDDGVAEGEFAEQPTWLVSFAILEMCVSIARWYRGDRELTPAQVASQYSEYAVRIARGEVMATGRPPA